jgi:hypothetical protein
MEPQLTEAHMKLGSLLGLLSSDDPRASLRAEASAADGEHDAYHRFVFRWLETLGLHPSSEELAEAATQLRTMLYPSGLNAIRVTFRQQVAATTPFANRLEQPAVQQALDALEKAGFALRPFAEAAVQAGRRLGEALSKLDLLEAELVSQPREAELFQARTLAHTWWSALMSNVALVFPGQTPEAIQNRETFFMAYRRARAEANRNRDTATVKELDNAVPAAIAET